MAKFTILFLTVAAAITDNKAITSLTKKNTSDEDEDYLPDTSADATQVIAENTPGF